MTVAIQDTQQELGNDTNGIGTSIQLVHEARIPRVDAIVQGLLDEFKCAYWAWVNYLVQSFQDTLTFNTCTLVRQSKVDHLV